AADAQPDIVLRAGNGARARAIENHAHLVDPFAHEFEGIQQSRAGDDGGAMLVIMEDRNLHRAAKLFLDEEALRVAYILQIDAAERRLKQLAGANDFLRISRGKLDIEYVDIRKALEQHRFAFHHRLAG